MNVAAPVAASQEKVTDKASTKSQSETRGKDSFAPTASITASCACGGSCPNCNSRKKTGTGILQKKLQVGASDDVYEQEADSVADQILAMPIHDSTIKKTPVRIQRLANQSATHENSAPDSVTQVLSKAGRPLDAVLQKDMGQRFGHDFSHVRIHSDASAEQSARQINANAYTSGNNIVFGSGQFAPTSQQGRRLLAHELTHVVQQSGESSTTKFAGLSGLRLQRQVRPPITASTDLSGIQARLDAIIRTGGPIPADQTRVIGAAIVEVEGYTGPTEIRAISGAATDSLGLGAPVHHALSPSARTLSATRTIGGSGLRREFPFSHTNDAEIKIFEEIAANLPPNARGRIHFSTMRDRVTGGTAVLEPIAACSGCTRATFEMGAFRNIDMVSHAVSHPTGSLEFSSRPTPVEPGAARGTSGPTPVPAEPITTPGVSRPTPIIPEPVARPATGTRIAITSEPHSGPVRIATPGTVEGSPRIPVRIAPPRTGSGRGGPIRLRAGRWAAGAAGTALFIVQIITDLIIQLVVLPWIERIQRQLEQIYRDSLQQQIQSYYEQFVQDQVDRMIYCALVPIRALEQQGRTAYVNVSLNVFFADTSAQLDQLFRSGPPESIFDLNFHRLSYESLRISDTPVEQSADALVDAEDSTFFGGNPLWRQTIHFSIVAPPASEIQAMYGPEGATPPSCSSCFIATACYGSINAPEVEALRRFRDCMLLPCLAGRIFVKVYYALSPPIADYLRNHDRARQIVSAYFVAPLVSLVKKMYWDGNRPLQK
jgi:hypothetical protein